MKKKFLSILLCICMALSLLPVNAAAEGADDLDTGLGFALSGKSDESITRAEMAKLVAYLALGSKEAGTLKCGSAPFSDVDSDDEYSPFIEYCCKSGIIEDKVNNSYDPDGLVTGYQAAKYLLCALDYGKSSDYTGSGWDLAVATDMNKSGLNKGLPSGFNGNDNLTRLNAALMARNASKFRAGKDITDMGIDVKSGKDEGSFSVSFTPAGGDDAKNVAAVYSGSSDGATVGLTFSDKLKADVTARDGELLSAAVVLEATSGGSETTANVDISDTDDIANILAAASAAAGIGAAVLSVAEGKEISIPQSLAPQVLIAPEEDSNVTGLTATVAIGLLSGLSECGGALTVRADNAGVCGALTLRGVGLNAALTQAGSNTSVEFRMKQVDENYFSGTFGEDMGGRILPGTTLNVDILAGNVSVNLGKSGGAAEVSLYPPAEIDTSLLMGVHSRNYSVTELYIQPDTAFAMAMDKIGSGESDFFELKPLESDYTLDLTHFSAVGLVLASWADAADTSWYDDTSTNFTLTTAGELAGLAAIVNGTAVDSEGTSIATDSFEGKTITLGKNIDLSGANWTPIGDENNYFKGTFDGGGKTISNLTIVSASDTYAALLGVSEGAKIENLTVGGSIWINAVGKDANAGGVAGIALSTHIEDCASDVDITLESSGNTACYAGGIAGRLIGEGDYQDTIVGCSNTSDISVTTTGDAYAGGIVGQLLSDRVYNSFNTGDVSVTITGSSGSYAGGIAGWINPQNGSTDYIANCYSVADITCNDSPSISPSGAGAMRNCYAYHKTATIGSYYNGYSQGNNIENADQLKALLSELNAWVSSPTVTLDVDETGFAPWYAGGQDNDGFPCFTPSYPLTVESSYTDGTAHPDGAGDYPEGKTVSIYAGTRPNYSFSGWTVVSGGVTLNDPSSSTTFFTMPHNAVAVKANWSYNGGGHASGSTYYTLTFNTNSGSTVSAITRAEYGRIDLSNYTPIRDGYSFTGWYADTELKNKITEVRLTKNTTVYAGWHNKTNPNTGAWNPFTDVSEGDWFYEYVQYVYENALMAGTATDKFSPQLCTTRGMIVTILWRLEGEPAATEPMSFTDVPAEKYYHDAVSWAAERDIVLGYDEKTFGPENQITREQLAAILHRYAAFKGYDVTGRDSLAAFTDKPSGWALENVQWAVAEGLMQGKGSGVLDPLGEALRCEFAVVLYRFTVPSARE